MTGAIADCERILDGFLGQPVNALTSLAFIGAGVLVAVRSRRVWLATALMAVGIGSFLFHGPMPAGAQWAHDVSVAWLLVVAGTSTSRWERLGRWPALMALGMLMWLMPVAADPVAALASVIAVGAILWRNRTARTWVAIGFLTVGAIVGSLSSTNGPWCNPVALLQGHGFWHVAAATAVAVWATGPHLERPRVKS
ncbi:MAG: hypothetical protein ACRDVD_03730 [Acidimicrobiia bacterium]